MLSASGKVSRLTLQSLIETAIREGANAIELEYVEEGLEVTYVSGNIGMGEVVDDRASITAIISELILQAKLEHKPRGVFKWVHESRAHEIRVEQFESFGESAFRILLKKPKKRA